MTPSQRKCPACGNPVENNVSASGQCLSCGHDLVTTAPRPAWFVGRVDVRKVARRQRQLLWVVLGSLLLQIGWSFVIARSSYSPVVRLSMFGVLAVLQIYAVVCVVHLQAALGIHVAWRVLVAILMLAPCVNLLVMAAVASRATMVLQQAGLKVGFMGTADEQVVRLLGSNRCRNCGYLLIGVESGICPECGQPVVPVQS